MEQYVALLGLLVIGGIAAVFVRWILKAYERLWNSDHQKQRSPAEFYGIVEEAVNEAIKKAQDRQRKAIRKLEPEPEVDTQALKAELSNLNESENMGLENDELDKMAYKFLEVIRRG